MPNDFAQLEHIEIEAQLDLYRAAPHDVREAHAVDAVRIGSVTCFGCRTFEPTAIFRRAVGLGVAQPAGERELDDVILHMSAHGWRYAVPLSPHARPATLDSWLERRAFTRGYAWMKFRRFTAGATSAASDLEIGVVGGDHGDEFGRVVAEGFGMPMSIGRWIGALPSRANWICVMAFDRDTPVGAGAAFVDGEYAWLGFGATLTSHRRRGAQSALLERRVREAAALGARVAVTETGERVPGRPSNSYRNILRAGFEEMYVRQNYMSPSPPATPAIER